MDSVKKNIIDIIGNDKDHDNDKNEMINNIFIVLY